MNKAQEMYYGAVAHEIARQLVCHFSVMVSDAEA